MHPLGFPIPMYENKFYIYMCVLVNPSQKLSTVQLLT